MVIKSLHKEKINEVQESQTEENAVQMLKHLYNLQFFFPISIIKI